MGVIPEWFIYIYNAMDKRAPSINFTTVELKKKTPYFLSLYVICIHNPIHLYLLLSIEEIRIRRWKSGCKSKTRREVRRRKRKPSHSIGPLTDKENEEGEKE